jgi:hypothetical protein
MVEGPHTNPVEQTKICPKSPNAGQERANLIGLTSLWINERSAVSEAFSHWRVVFVLGKIDEILSWERNNEREKDARFVEPKEYLCALRAKQFWRLENLRSFDEILEKRFPNSRRNAYYLMEIHENLGKRPVATVL